MIAWAGATFLIAAFALLIVRLRLLAVSQRVLVVVGEALATMGDRRLDDDGKERRMQRLAVRLVARLALVLGGFSLAAGAPLGALWLVDGLVGTELSAVVDVTLSPAFVALSSLLLVAALATTRRARAPGTPVRYSLGEQLLHRLAFCTPRLQRAAAALEDRLFAARLERCDPSRPIFVAGLPRAGTTLLLECFARLPEIATHRYRDMPFVWTPLLWATLSGKFQQASRTRERAHGDGVMVDFDSPEAFEEMLWLELLPRAYGRDRIEVQTADGPGEGPRHPLAQQLRKIIRLRCPEAGGRGRYVSKNNGNASRLSLLRATFPACSIVVPFREPLEQCLSLLRQHQRFTRLHAEDGFASEYMRQIGHFDFGENLLPIDFGGWLDAREHADPQTLGFWLEYWIATYSHLLEDSGSGRVLLDYDRLCERPGPVLESLARAVGLSEPRLLAAQAGAVRARRPRPIDVEPSLQGLVARARALLVRLQARSLRAAPALPTPQAHEKMPARARARGKATSPECT